MTVVRPYDPVTHLADTGANDVAGPARDLAAEVDPEVRSGAGSRRARSIDSIVGREVHQW